MFCKSIITTSFYFLAVTLLEDFPNMLSARKVQKLNMLYVPPFCTRCRMAENGEMTLAQLDVADKIENYPDPDKKMSLSFMVSFVTKLIQNLKRALAPQSRTRVRGIRDKVASQFGYPEGIRDSKKEFDWNEENFGKMLNVVGQEAIRVAGLREYFPGWMIQLDEESPELFFVGMQMLDFPDLAGIISETLVSRVDSWYKTVSWDELYDAIKKRFTSTSHEITKREAYYLVREYALEINDVARVNNFGRNVLDLTSKIPPKLDADEAGLDLFAGSENASKEVIEKALEEHMGFEEHNWDSKKFLGDQDVGDEDTEARLVLTKLIDVCETWANRVLKSPLKHAKLRSAYRKWGRGFPYLAVEEVEEEHE